jgi:hypothetical protein
VVVQVAAMRRYAPAFERACEIVGQMQAKGDIRLARVHDVIFIWNVRAFIYEQFARTAGAPGIADIAERFGITSSAIAASIPYAFSGW